MQNKFLIVALIWLACTAKPSIAQNNNGRHAAPFRVVVVELQPYGFVPQKIERPLGPFVLVVHNYTGRTPISLRLNSAIAGLSNAGLIDKWNERGIRRMSPVLSLPAGEYVLWEASRPQQRLTVLIGR